MTYLLNSRPLINENKGNDVLPITGNWLLHPYRQYAEDINLNAIIQSAHKGTVEFWDEWITHVPHQLFQYTKWNESKPNPNVGDSVLIIKQGFGNQRAPRKYWKQAVIVECKESKDGVARKVSVKFSSGRIENHVVQNLVVITPPKWN